MIAAVDDPVACAVQILVIHKAMGVSPIGRLAVMSSQVVQPADRWKATER